MLSAAEMQKNPLTHPFPEGRGRDGNILPLPQDSAAVPLPLHGLNSTAVQGQGGGKKTRYPRGGVNRKASPQIMANAKTLRNNLTEAEKKLWYYLRGKRFGDYKFRRQHPIGNYIVDFVCTKQAIVIELDGGQHSSNLKDIDRTASLNGHGFAVLRFWNNEVLENIEGVLMTIEQHLSNDPLPHPLPEGRGCMLNLLPLQGGGHRSPNKATLEEPNDHAE